MVVENAGVRAFIVLLAALFALTGCSDSNDSASLAEADREHERWKAEGEEEARQAEWDWAVMWARADQDQLTSHSPDEIGPDGCFPNNPPPPPGLEFYSCDEHVDGVLVTDGDTIATRLGPARLIGIDAPETYPIADCYGNKARRALEKLVELGPKGQDPRPRRKRVFRLERIHSHPNTDDYGRFLRKLVLVAWLPTKRDQYRTDTIDAAEWLIRNGYARASRYAYQYGRPSVGYHLRPYIVAERRARKKNLGGWAACGWK